VRIGAPERSSLKLIELLGLSGKVLYRRATESEIALYYNAADLLVYTAYYEGFGMPLLEAMASGTPVVASDAAAIPEIVGGTSILLNPFDVVSFAYWINEVLSNEELRIRLSEKGYERSLSFSWESCARDTMNVYREVIDKY
jgi:glycosyltransferase involved in cell wall biosynthesis